MIKATNKYSYKRVVMVTRSRHNIAIETAMHRARVYTNLEIGSAQFLDAILPVTLLPQQLVDLIIEVTQLKLSQIRYGNNNIQFATN